DWKRNRKEREGRKQNLPPCREPLHAHGETWGGIGRLEQRVEFRVAPPRAALHRAALEQVQEGCRIGILAGPTPLTHAAIAQVQQGSNPHDKVTRFEFDLDVEIRAPLLLDDLLDGPGSAKSQIQR